MNKLESNVLEALLPAGNAGLDDIDLAKKTKMDFLVVDQVLADLSKQGLVEKFKDPDGFDKFRISGLSGSASGNAESEPLVLAIMEKPGVEAEFTVDFQPVESEQKPPEPKTMPVPRAEPEPKTMPVPRAEPEPKAAAEPKKLIRRPESRMIHAERAQVLSGEKTSGFFVPMVYGALAALAVCIAFLFIVILPIMQKRTLRATEHLVTKAQFQEAAQKLARSEDLARLNGKVEALAKELEKQKKKEAPKAATPAKVSKPASRKRK